MSKKQKAVVQLRIWRYRYEKMDCTACTDVSLYCIRLYKKRNTTVPCGNGIQNQDSDAVKASSDWKDFNIKAFSVDDSDYMDSVDKKLQKQTYEKMMYFEHKEGKETIQDNQATVTVKIKQYDFSKTLKSGMEQAEKKVQELSKKDVSDAETEAAIATVLFKSLQKTDTMKTTDVQIQLKKTEDVWMVSSDNAQLEKLLSANLNLLQEQ